MPTFLLRSPALTALMSLAVLMPWRVEAAVFLRGEMVRLREGETLKFEGKDYASGAKGQEFRVLKHESGQPLAYVGVTGKDGRLIAASLPVEVLETAPGWAWNDVLAGTEAFRDGQPDVARKFFERAAKDEAWRDLAAMLALRLDGAIRSTQALRAADGARAAIVRQGWINTLAGLRDFAADLMGRGLASVAVTLDEGVDRLGAGASEAPASRLDRADWKPRVEAAARMADRIRQAVAHRRMVEAQEHLESGMTAEPLRPDFLLVRERIAKSLAEAEERYQAAEKMRRHGAKGAIHALTAIEMGLKECADYPRLRYLKSEMQSAFEERTAPPVTPELAALAGREISMERLKSGHQLYTARCTECHDLELLDSRSMQGWEQTVAGMSRRANLSDSERAQILDYLRAAQRGLE
jgi:hypothetical protein